VHLFFCCFSLLSFVSESFTVEKFRHMSSDENWPAGMQEIQVGDSWENINRQYNVLL